MQSGINGLTATSSRDTYFRMRNDQATGANIKNAIQNSNLNDAENIKKMREAYSSIDVKELTNGYLSFYQNQSAQNSNSNFSAQFSAFNFSDLVGTLGNSAKTADEISNMLSGIDLKSTGYEGKPIWELTQKEAANLVSDKGFFGIDNTADRMSGFVINGAGDDLDRLRAGREGIVKGYEDAKKAWGGDLPEISQKTMQKALETVDKRIAELGGSVVNVQA